MAIAPSEFSIRQAGDAYLEAVTSGDAVAQRRAVQAWTYADTQIGLKLDALLAKIAAAQEAGTPVTEAWLYQVGRLEQLSAYMAAQYAQLSIQVERAVASAQRKAISTSIDATTRLIGLETALVDDPRLDTAHLDVAQFSRLIGNLQDGSPLRDLTFSNLTVEGRDSVTRALVAGVAAGESVDHIRQRIALERGMTQARAQTIVRTEVLRVAREASMGVMGANAHLLNGWRWSAHLDHHSCGVCVSLQGHLFPMSHPFDSHPNCRCAPVPDTKSWKELGYPGIRETSVRMSSGDTWISKMSGAELRRAFGPTLASLLQGGYLKAADMVRWVDVGRWGTQPRLRTVPDMKALATTRGWTPPVPLPPPTVRPTRTTAPGNVIVGIPEFRLTQTHIVTGQPAPPAPTAAAISAVNKVAVEMSQIKDGEQIRLFDAQGNLVWQKSSQGLLQRGGSVSYGVDFPPDEWAKMMSWSHDPALGGLVSVHNHPSGWSIGPKANSSAFSKDDMDSAWDLNLSAMIVVTREYIYTLTPGTGGWGPKSALFDSMERASAQVQNTIMRQLAEAQLRDPNFDYAAAIQEAEWQHWDRVWQLVARELGYNFTKTYLPEAPAGASAPSPFTTTSEIPGAKPAPEPPPISEPKPAPLLNPLVADIPEAPDVQEDPADYRMAHTAPGPEGGTPIYNLDAGFPADIYDQSVQTRYYGTGDSAADAESWDAINTAQGNPDAYITIYRAVPTGVNTINSGDWVTTSRIYAEQHAERMELGTVLAVRVRANQLWWDGNSVNEWGYSGPNLEAGG